MPQVDVLARVVDALGKKIEDVVDIPPETRFPGDWRILRGLTQPQLGQLITNMGVKISTATIGAIERADTDIRPDIARLMAQALQVSEEELYASHERARKRPPGSPA